MNSPSSPADTTRTNDEPNAEQIPASGKFLIGFFVFIFLAFGLIVIADFVVGFWR